MHKKTYSDGATSHETASPPAPRPAYFVQSPTNADVDTGSGFSPVGSPVRQHRHVSDGYYDHSRESSVTSRFSEPLKNQSTFRSYAGYSTLEVGRQGDDDDDFDDGETEGPDERRAGRVRFYMCLFFAFALAFTLFCLILWGVSKSFAPKITLQEMVFESLNVQAGSDESGVPTDMLSMNSTVKILYRNPSTFFALHVTSSPLRFTFSELILASAQIEKFSQPRKSQRIIETNVEGDQVPLYGSIPVLNTQRTQPDLVSLPLNLTFTLRSRAYVLGRLVKTKFYSRVICTVTLRGDKLGTKLDLSKSCSESDHR